MALAWPPRALLPKCSCKSADGGMAIFPSLPGSGMTDTQQQCDWEERLETRD